MTQFFNPAQDAQQLKEALEKPRNIDTIISIAAHRSNAQRQQIVQAYYNENKKILGTIFVLYLVAIFKKH